MSEDVPGSTASVTPEVWPPKKKRRKWPPILVLILVLGLAAVVASMNGGGGRDSPADADALPAAAPETDYEKLSEREWTAIAKDPGSYEGRAVIVYGVVTQFDAATGPGLFLANLGHKDFELAYEYPTNTVVNGSESELADLVEGDEFTAKVRVVGAMEYDTQIGGSTVAPEVVADSVTKL